MIVFRFDASGNFTCGDTVTKLTSYAYATSTHARQAKTRAPKVAAEMLAGEHRYGLPHEQDSDARHWRTLNNV